MERRRIVRTSQGWGLDRDGERRALESSLSLMLAGAPIRELDRELPGELIAPVDRQEVWAAGVTHRQSLDARRSESREPDVYERVFQAPRPELFFKCLPERVVGPDGTAGIREDSSWNVPEPEVGLVLDTRGRIFGFTIGDDVSSRSIEGENPLYLPQAKIYEGSCVLGPWIVPAADAEHPFEVALKIERGGDAIFDDRTSTMNMYRTFDELADWLFRGLTFPHGVVLLTGTDLVPPASVTLEEGDRVTIDVSGIGTLAHAVQRVGRGRPLDAYSPPDR